MLSGYAYLFPGLLTGCYKIHVHLGYCNDLKPNYVVIRLQSEFNEVINFIALFIKLICHVEISHKIL